MDLVQIIETGVKNLKFNGGYYHLSFTDFSYIYTNIVSEKNAKLT